ncbi:MAG: hypothetical protein M1483_00705 [Actinobacteria bacterium]|nr:hypothetical protein [Actinomycetota bacterium]MCL6104154.1 hypothetical protein [Actinomycetota bacterium]
MLENNFSEIMGYQVGGDYYCVTCVDTIDPALAGADDSAFFNGEHYDSNIICKICGAVIC